MDERKPFNSEREALAYARQIEKSIQTNGAQPTIAKEKIVFVSAYEKLIERLTPYSKTPEDAVSFFVQTMKSSRWSKELLKNSPRWVTK